ncbi:MAG: hypothetical protein MRY21_05220 [Simkaniaceae bacterium]|nr:hypothetical protein [Simkaniaceae bacterium]
MDSLKRMRADDSITFTYFCGEDRMGPFHASRAGDWTVRDVVQTCLNQTQWPHYKLKEGIANLLDYPFSSKSAEETPCLRVSVRERGGKRFVKKGSENVSPTASLNVKIHLLNFSKEYQERFSEYVKTAETCKRVCLPLGGDLRATQSLADLKHLLKEVGEDGRTSAPPRLEAGEGAGVLGEGGATSPPLDF